MPRKLKVFRTAIGFDDAYVAAPSRKAALAAWGAHADLFARGVAEEVTDSKLSAEPLAHPGEVIRLSRGDLAQHLKTLPRAARRKPTVPTPARKPSRKSPPTREKVDAAEKALADLIARQEVEAGELERALEKLRAKHNKDRSVVERQRDRARKSYREAMEQWSS